MLSSAAKESLELLGYLILPCFPEPAQVERFNHRLEEIFAEEDYRAGAEFKQEPGTRRLRRYANIGI